MEENEDALLARLQKSLDAVKQVCVEWFASLSEISAVLDSWSSLFEEYYCASLVAVETTPLSVHSDVAFLTKSKTKRQLARMLDELQIHQCVSFVHISLSRLICYLEHVFVWGLTKYRKGPQETAKDCTGLQKSKKYHKGLLIRRKLPKFCTFLPLYVECK